MSTPRYAAYEAIQPYFDLVLEALSGVVDGEHYFDTLAENMVFEALYDFPGWPRTIHGRASLMTQFSGYGNNIKLHTADKLVVHPADDGRVIVFECEVHGTIVKTGNPYTNRLLSVVTVDNRKIVYWRDYLDSLAAWNALTAPAH